MDREATGTVAHLPVLDVEKHVYTIGGRRIPSVTQILAANGFYEFPFASPEDLAYKMQLGTDVHHAAHLHDIGRLDYNTITEEVGAYFEGWLRFRAEHPEFKIRGSERIIYHPALDYAGQLDRVLDDGSELILGDIKCGAELPAAALQTAAYKAANNERCKAADHIGRRVSIHLNGNGRYRLVWHTNPQDFRAFCAALTLFHWKEKNV
jgi:hypothetical protein